MYMMNNTDYTMTKDTSKSQSNNFHLVYFREYEDGESSYYDTFEHGYTIFKNIKFNYNNHQLISSKLETIKELIDSKYKEEATNFVASRLDIVFDDEYNRKMIDEYDDWYDKDEFLTDYGQNRETLLRYDFKTKQKGKHYVKN